MNKVHYAHQTLQRPNDVTPYTAGDLVSRTVGLAQVPLVFDFDEVNTIWTGVLEGTNPISAGTYNKIINDTPRVNYPKNPLRLEHVTAVKSSANVTNASFNLLFFDMADRTIDINSSNLLNDGAASFLDNTPFQFLNITTAADAIGPTSLFRDTAVAANIGQRFFGPRLRLLGVYSATFSNPGLQDAAGNAYATATFVPPTGSPGIVIRNSRVIAFLLAAGAYTPVANERFSLLVQGVELT